MYSNVVKKSRFIRAGNSTVGFPPKRLFSVISLYQNDSMAHKSYQGIPRARYISFYSILILNIKWPLADILIWKASTSSFENT